MKFNWKQWEVNDHLIIIIFHIIKYTEGRLKLNCA